MNSGKLLVLAAFAGAALFLFTTDKGKEIREELGDAAGDWGDKLSDLAEKASCSAKDLKKLVSREVAGLSEEARARIAAIIDEGTKMAKGMKKEVESQVA
jgi:gas vesicle protein